MHIPKHGGDVLRVAKRLGIPPSSILDFSSNLNPLGPPKWAIDVIVKSVKSLKFYPDSDYSEARSALAKLNKVKKENVIVGNGATEIIHLFSRLASPKGAAVIPIPTFEEYAWSYHKAGGSITEVEMGEEFDFPSRRIKEHILRGAKALFICNPNNPTGKILPEKIIRTLIEFAERRDVLVLVDESFMDFVDDGKRYSLINEASTRNNLIVVKSMTKVLSLPGLRIGYAVSNEDIIKSLREIQPNWSVNSLAESVLIRSAKELTHFLKRSREFIIKNKKLFLTMLERINGITPIPSDSNFFMLKVSRIRSDRVKAYLLKERILVRDCSSFHGIKGEFIRIAVRKEEENIILVKALRKLYRWR